MRWIYISPHLDDAVLSCGGLIREQTSSKTPVEIWTVCTMDPPSEKISPFANLQHTQWSAGLDAFSMRRSEDIAACQLMGARYRHLPFLDCIYRQSKDGFWLYASEQAIFGDLSVEDAATLYTLQTFLAAILKPDDILVVPLTIGKHVDHQMVRIATEGLGRPLLYYADLPYAIDHPEKIDEATLNFKSQLFEVSHQNLASWQNASLAYRSQLNVLFDGEENMRSDIETYYQREKGLRLWRSDNN